MATDLLNEVKDIGVLRKSDRLDRKHIAFCVSGGIGSVEAVKLIREIRRHGATVHPFMTASSAQFITPLSISWAAAQNAVVELGPEADHLAEFDLVVVAPATLNTIAKSSQGIADNAVMLVIASQLGSRKNILFVPAMNEKLSHHPRFPELRSQLIQWGARFLETAPEEGRLKMPSPEVFAEEVLKYFS